MAALDLLGMAVPNWRSELRRDDRHAQRALNIVVVAGVEDEISDTVEAVEGTALHRDVAGVQRIRSDVIAAIHGVQALTGQSHGSVGATAHAREVLAGNGLRQ